MLTNAGGQSENIILQDCLQPAAIFAQEMDKVLDESDRIFSGEEFHGKYLDL